MKRKPHSTSLVLLLVCIFTFWWGISVLAQHDLRSMVVVADQSTQALAPIAPEPLAISVISIDGSYTYSGTYNTKSGCDSFGSGIHYSAVNGGHVSILLITSPASVNCAQAASVTQGQPFSVSIKMHSKSAPIFDGVQVNGAAIPARLVEAI